MANQKTLILDAGKRQQIAAVDTLLTGAGIDRSVPGIYLLGASVATQIDIGKVGVDTFIRGNATVDGDETIVGDITVKDNAIFEGNTTIGNAPTDTLSIPARLAGSFVGLKEDDHIFTIDQSTTLGVAGATWTFIGGKGANASGATPGGLGGLVTFQNGPGGDGTATLAAGGGRLVSLTGGDAGAANGGPGSAGGSVEIDGGLGSGGQANGFIKIGTIRATEIRISSGSIPVKFKGTGLKTFEGLADFTGGLVSNTNFRFVESSDPTQVANSGFIYTKDDGGDTELFYKDDSGNVVQVTQDGTLSGPGLTLGSVPFGGAGGKLAEDNANIFWDDTKKALGLGTNSIDASAILELSSTTKGFLPPRMTDGQRDAISSPATGLGIYNTTTNKPNLFNGTAWKQVVVTPVATLTIGSIPFVTAAGEIDDDNANLSWDNVTKELNVASVKSPKFIASAGAPVYQFEETDAAADEKKWQFQVDSEVFKLETLNDAETVFVPRLEITRSSGLINFKNGDVLFDGQAQIAGSAATSSTTFAVIGNTQWRMQINVGDEGNAGVIDYRNFNANALTIVGAGAGSNRRVHIFDYMGIGISPLLGIRLLLPLENDPVTPTLAFGDGDSGFYESADDSIVMASAGVARFQFNGAFLRAVVAGGSALLNETASATNPSVIPNHADVDTGLGSSAADQLSLIAGGVEQVRLDVTGNHTINSLLDEATGNEAALSLNYTANKATSGNDTGLLINKTDTLSPGTSLLLDLQLGGTSMFVVEDDGKVGIANGIGNLPQYRLDVGDASYFAINGLFAHIVQHNNAASTFWSIAPRNGGDLDIAVTTTDPRPSGGTIGASDNAISIKTNKNVEFLSNVGIGMANPVANTTAGVLQVGLANATTVPTGTVTGGGILYSTSGVLHWLKSDGIDVDLLAAGAGLDNIVEDLTPQLGGQLDVNGFSIGDGTLELLKFVETASAVNELTITNAATGGAPALSATGDDTNIDLRLNPKGTGGVGINVTPSSALHVAGSDDASTRINVARFGSNSLAPRFQFSKSSGVGIGSAGALAGGDSIGELAFVGNDGTSFRDGASIVAQTTQPWTTSALGTEIRFNTVPNGSTVNTLRMTIAESGQVDIVGTATASNLKTHSLIENRSPTTSTASTTFVTLESASAVTFSGRPVLCFVNATMFPSVLNLKVELAIQIDSGSDAVAAQILHNETEHNTVQGAVIVTPTAGSHTLRVRWRVASGSGTLTLDANDQILLHAVEL